MSDEEGFPLAVVFFAGWIPDFFPKPSFCEDVH
jgi:hypothetical protein